MQPMKLQAKQKEKGPGRGGRSKLACACRSSGSSSAATTSCPCVFLAGTALATSSQVVNAGQTPEPRASADAPAAPGAPPESGRTRRSPRCRPSWAARAAAAQAMRRAPREKKGRRTRAARAAPAPVPPPASGGASFAARPSRGHRFFPSCRRRCKPARRLPPPASHSLLLRQRSLRLTDCTSEGGASAETQGMWIGFAATPTGSPVPQPQHAANKCRARWGGSASSRGTCCPHAEAGAQLPGAIIFVWQFVRRLPAASAPRVPPACRGELPSPSRRPHRPFLPPPPPPPPLIPLPATPAAPSRPPS